MAGRAAWGAALPNHWRAVAAAVGAALFGGGGGWGGGGLDPEARAVVRGPRPWHGPREDSIAARLERMNQGARDNTDLIESHQDQIRRLQDQNRRLLNSAETITRALDIHELELDTLYQLHPDTQRPKRSLLGRGVAAGALEKGG